MRRILSLLSITVCIFVPTVAQSEDAQSILRTVLENRILRSLGVENYIVEESMMGNRVVLYYECAVPQPPGCIGYRQVPLHELAAERPGAEGFDFTPEQLDQAAGAVATAGTMARSEMGKAGMPLGLLESGSQPWLATDPAGMFDMYSMFLGETANAKRELAKQGDGTREAQQEIVDMLNFAAVARLVATETIEGKEAFHLQADELNLLQKVKGAGKGSDEFTLQTINLWIDTEKYVPLRMKMDGVYKSGKKSSPVTIERLDPDYREVHGSNMYESYKQILRFVVTDPKQMAEMEKMRQQMAEVEEQMKRMSESQREMIERQMGPQLETMKRMAAGEGIVVEVDVHEIRVNSGPPKDQDFARMFGIEIPGNP